MKNNIFKNTVSLYIINIAKLILPLVTLPYLTRVLSKDCYGVVSYVKSTMQYMQMLIDFGFVLSGTKDIIKSMGDKNKLSSETSSIFFAKLLLSGTSAGIMLIFTMIIPILRNNFGFTLLSFIPVFLTVFLFDYFFRSIEQMHIITMRFVAMKLTSTILTFILVKSDNDMLLIPVLDIIGSIIAVIMVWYELKKKNVRIVRVSFRTVLNKIKKSVVYFVSDIATTAFGALNTLLIGIYMNEADVAEWSLCMQLVVAVQSMYAPITSGIYPEMVKNRNIRVVKKVMKIFVPLITAGCIFTLIVAEYALLIVGGHQYTDAADVLRCLVPVMFFSFFSRIYGWPTLGAIGKSKETSFTTIISAVIQIGGIVLLIYINKLNLISIAILRGITEFLLFILRYRYYLKYKDKFAHD